MVVDNLSYFFVIESWISQALLLGVIVSMIVGYAALKLLQKIVMNEKFHLFAYYCWTVGAAIIFLSIFQ